MQLLTDDVRQLLPSLGAQDESQDPTVYVKYFTPDAGWTWYATEGEERDGDFLFFGFVVGPFPEWGYFTLCQLQEVRGAMRLPVERDLYFSPKSASQISDIKLYTDAEK